MRVLRAKPETKVVEDSAIAQPVSTRCFISQVIGYYIFSRHGSRPAVFFLANFVALLRELRDEKLWPLEPTRNPCRNGAFSKMDKWQNGA